MSAAPGIVELRQAVRAAAGRFAPGLLDRDGALSAVSEWSAIVNAAQAACDLASARVAECGAGRGAEDEIARRTGTSSAKAKQRIGTGNRLRKHDRARKAATSGQLSGDQSALIADAVDVNPDAEDELLDVAQRRSHTELRDECANKKMAVDPNPAATEKRIHLKRRLRRWTDTEGAAHLHATDTKRDMARLDSALQREADAIFKHKRDDGVRESIDAYLFDALIQLADRPGGDDKEPTIRNLGLLRLDWSALMRGYTVGDETCEIVGLGPIPVATARDMLGESILKLVITKGVDVANVVHLGRGPTTAQKVALMWMQPRCTNQACGRIHHLEIDHRHEWHKNRQTVLGNLEPLCPHDHDLKTRFGWSLVDGKGPRAFVPPDHPDHPTKKRRRK